MWQYLVRCTSHLPTARHVNGDLSFAGLAPFLRPHRCDLEPDPSGGVPASGGNKSETGRCGIIACAYLRHDLCCRRNSSFEDVGLS
jgi:hypothetical protein